MALTYTYDPSDATNVTLVRMRTGDTNVANGGQDALFSDEEYGLMLKHEGDDVLLACAHAYEIIAGNTALYVGKQSFLNNFTDGPAISLELMRIASEWRSMRTSVI